MLSLQTKSPVFKGELVKGDGVSAPGPSPDIEITEGDVPSSLQAVRESVRAKVNTPAILKIRLFFSNNIDMIDSFELLASLILR